MKELMIHIPSKVPFTQKQRGKKEFDRLIVVGMDDHGEGRGIEPVVYMSP